MKQAQVYIDGEVYSGSWQASITGVREMLEYQGQFDSIQVTINSMGGDIAEGLGIYDLLQSYGVPITTVVIGQCCSAATIIFLAGKERIIYENVVAFMVHQASVYPQSFMTEDQLRTMADFLKSYNDRMSAIYQDKTKASAETVADWMSVDTYMTAEEALANGFATIIAKPVEAKAYLTPRAVEQPAVTTSNSESITQKTMSYFKDKARRVMASLSAIADGKTIQAKAYSLEDGTSINIDQAGDSYSEGDEVTKDGAPYPDETIQLKDGPKITIKDGKIEKIEADEAGDEDEDTSDDVTASDESTVSASAETQTEGVTPATTETETPAVTALRKENETLKTEKKTMQKTMNSINAKMKILLAGQTSPDVAVPNSGQQNKSVTARATTTEAEDKRNTMLESRKQRGLKYQDKGESQE